MSKVFNMDKIDKALECADARITELEALKTPKCTRCEQPIADGCICGKCLRESNAAKEDIGRASGAQITELENQLAQAKGEVGDYKEALQDIEEMAYSIPDAKIARTALVKHEPKHRSDDVDRRNDEQ